MSKDQKVKAIVELAIIEARINELERSKTYNNSLTYYRNRLTTLTDKADKLRNQLEGNDETEEIKLVFSIPAGGFRLNKEKPVKTDFLQFLKKEYLVEV